jgi:formate dehydrogenase iron-sulfur subunit
LKDLDLQAGTRYGFFTDTSVCIGCKACEVACKEWNQVPGSGFEFTATSYDNTVSLGANTWRHVAFIEQPAIEQPAIQQPAIQQPACEEPACGESVPGAHDFRFLMSSDVCKHCTSAACLEVCPTGAIFTTEFQTIVVQDDICNGCGYCVTACPFGVIERRETDGGAWKCTLCYDRMRGNKMPACAQACPTDSIQFGPLDELRARAERRVQELDSSGVVGARLYGHDEDDGVAGFGAFFLLLDEPEVYGLPPDPVTPTRHLWSMWRTAAAAAGGLAVALAGAFVRSGRG